MPIIEKERSPIPAQKTVDHFVQEARIDRHKRWDAIQKAFENRDGQLRALRDKYPRSRSVRIAALYEAGVRLPSINQWQLAAGELDLLEPIDHVVDYWRQPKKPNGHRVVCDLSFYMNAAHRIIADLLRAQMHVPTFVYNVIPTGNVSRRTGRNGLMLDLLARLRSGFTHYRIYDVRDCFNSVSSDALIPPNLPLQRRLYENILNLENLCFRHDTIREQKHFTGIPSYRDIMTAQRASEPEGLLQGSPASNVILAYILQNIPQPDPRDGCMFLFGDDLIVLSRTKEFVDVVDQSLIQFFGQPSLGSLQLLQLASGHFGSFEYLGYEVSYSAVSDDWHVGLNAKNWSKYERMRDLELAKRNPQQLRLFSDAPIRHRIWSALRGHPLLSDPLAIMDTIMAGGMDEVERHRAFLLND